MKGLTNSLVAWRKALPNHPSAQTMSNRAEWSGGYLELAWAEKRNSNVITHSLTARKRKRNRGIIMWWPNWWYRGWLCNSKKGKVAPRVAVLRTMTEGRGERGEEKEVNKRKRWKEERNDCSCMTWLSRAGRRGCVSMYKHPICAVWVACVRFNFQQRYFVPAFSLILYTRLHVTSVSKVK